LPITPVNEGNGNNPAPARTDHRQQQRLSHIEKTMQAHLNRQAPLFHGHPRHRRIGMNPGIVDQHLNRPGLQQVSQNTAGLCGISDIEHRSFRRTTRRMNRCDNRFRLLWMTAAVGNDMQTIIRQLPTNRLAQIAAAASHQRPFHGLTSTLNPIPPSSASIVC
jgi:hypothetical protein